MPRDWTPAFLFHEMVIGKNALQAPDFDSPESSASATELFALANKTTSLAFEKLAVHLDTHMTLRLLGTS